MNSFELFSFAFEVYEAMQVFSMLGRGFVEGIPVVQSTGKASGRPGETIRPVARNNSLCCTPGKHRVSDLVMFRRRTRNKISENNPNKHEHLLHDSVI